MTMLGFHTLFPREAESECRTVTPFGGQQLPSHTFLFVEAYCVQPGCDCRRVLLNVIDTQTDEQVATINYAFEAPKPPYADEEQVFLDPLNPQSKLSGALLDLFVGMIANDDAYHARLVRHYKMWRKVVDDPKHPAQETIRSARSGSGILPQPVRRAGPKIGPNAPCPCGSGRKYKTCCRS